MKTEWRSPKSGEATTIYGTIVLDDGCISPAREVIAKYKKKGVILGGGLDDDVILCDNQRKRVCLDFTVLDPDSYRANWETFFGVPWETFLTRLKCGIVLKFGEASLETLKALIKDFSRFLQADKEEAARLAKNGVLSQPGLFLDLLLRLPIVSENEGQRDFLAGQIEEASFFSARSRRELPDFKSCFIVDSILRDFWPKASKEQKMVLWPIYLGWYICMVIPTRPTEFLLTPADCLVQKENGKWWIRLRKSHLKGGHSEIGYRIAEDFDIKTYPIPARIAESILEYKALLKKEGVPTPRLGTLFSPELHSMGMGRGRSWAASYYTYGLYTCALHYFYAEIVEKMYGFTVCQEHNIPEDDESVNRIAYIRPGDARHFSLINMAAENVPVEVMVVLAGHSGQSQTAHYAGNVGSYEKSATHRAYFEKTSSLPSLTPLFFGAGLSIKDGDPFIELDEGRCYSPHLLRDDASDCVKSIGKRGELGWCPSCMYFRNSNPTLTISDCSQLVKPIEEDWRLLREMIDSYRKEFLGKQEAILRIILKLQTDENILKRYLERVMKERATVQNNGTSNS